MRALLRRWGHATLGAVDAFLSHSWSDPPAAKWSVLREWAEGFERREARPPSVWLDKACINQQCIEQSLAGLPVFLSGCRELVVLVGSTYLTRLWCCVELYTFLKMGGTLDRVSVLPVGLRVEALEMAIGDFDAARCACFNEEDKQRLLAVVEAGFGTYRRFNDLVQASLLKRLRSS